MCQLRDSFGHVQRREHVSWLLVPQPTDDNTVLSAGGVTRTSHITGLNQASQNG